MTDYEKNMERVKKELHVNAATLDKALLNILRSKPKDAATLYQRLEKEFDMPIVKIKHIFSGIPLDRLISKKIREMIDESIDYKSGDIIVGLIDDELNIVASSKVPGHAELMEKYPDWLNRKTIMWRYNKRLKTLFFWITKVSKNTVEFIEDYLESGGYTVKTIQNIYNFVFDSAAERSAIYHSHGGDSGMFSHYKGDGD